MSDHIMHAFRTCELCSGRVSVKLLSYYKIYSSKVGPQVSTAKSTKGSRAILRRIKAYTSVNIYCHFISYIKKHVTYNIRFYFSIITSLVFLTYLSVLKKI